MSARYAIYLAPAPDSSLWQKASGWLARDAATDTDQTFTGPGGFDPARVAEITDDARRYGFHATLKAPFHLAPGKTPSELCEAAEAFAQGQSPFPVPLKLAALGSFLALVPAEPSADIARLHAEALTAFEPFRAPLTEADLARRLKSRLSDRQKDHLAQWGYPYVLEDFRVHYTLTCSLPEDERAEVATALADHFADDVAEPISVDAICVFEEPVRGAPFRILYRAPFARV